MSKLKAWIYAFRLRTLPLAFSSIITGAGTAFLDNGGNINYTVLSFAFVTTLLLQILSNLANDYGDSEKGTDNHERIGPVRAVQAGMLSRKEIIAGIIVTSLLALLSGILLITFAFGSGLNTTTVFFFLLGLSAIAAAVKYTVGKGAYGYRALGDVSVFIFFGIVGVAGTYYLLTTELQWYVLLPAASIGFFSSGVLHLNNMRDMEGDAKAGKITLANKLGLRVSKRHHAALIILGFICALTYVAVDFKSTMQLTFVITSILFRKHLVTVSSIENPADFDPLLKELAISTFIFSVLFALGGILSL